MTVTSTSTIIVFFYFVKFLATRYLSPPPLLLKYVSYAHAYM